MVFYGKIIRLLICKTINAYLMVVAAILRRFVSLEAARVRRVEISTYVSALRHPLANLPSVTISVTPQSRVSKHVPWWQKEVWQKVFANLLCVRHFNASQASIEYLSLMSFV